MSKIIQAYADSYRQMQRNGAEEFCVWSIIYDIERNMVPNSLDNPKDDQVAKFVNDLRDVAEKFKDTQQLRARIAVCVKDFLDQLK